MISKSKRLSYFRLRIQPGLLGNVIFRPPRASSWRDQNYETNLKIPARASPNPSSLNHFALYTVFSKILLTNDDGWDAPGLAMLKQVAAELGEVYVLAPQDPHSYAGHRVTTDVGLHLVETGPNELSLTGTPADCVRVALTHVFPDIDWVLSGINRGGEPGLLAVHVL